MNKQLYLLPLATFIVIFGCSLTTQYPSSPPVAENIQATPQKLETAGATEINENEITSAGIDTSVIISETNSDIEDAPNEDTIEENNADSYTNSWLGFSISLPEDGNYCLNDFCENTVADEDMQHFNISYYAITGMNFLKIRPQKNYEAEKIIDTFTFTD
ncbi:MAG: hypothetical protein Q8P90_05370 [bacterium]|nr:hypothetical protein [bacterium]